MKLYCYAKAGVMQHHSFTDDVAIVKAKSRKEAIEKLSKLYDQTVLIGNVNEVTFIDDIFIATDY